MVFALHRNSWIECALEYYREGKALHLDKKSWIRREQRLHIMDMDMKIIITAYINTEVTMLHVIRQQ
jgi:hypothetical protein